MWFVCPQEVWLLSRERQLKEEMRRKRDKEIELAIWTLEEETSKDKEECERAADNRCDCVREGNFSCCYTFNMADNFVFQPLVLFDETDFKDIVWWKITLDVQCDKASTDVNSLL